MSIRPILKWAGGKRRLLAKLRPHFPETYEGFIEPFFGGGAVFFGIAPACSLVADVNGRLINTYVTLRDNVEAVITTLEGFKNDKESYLAVRSSGRLDSADAAEAAATFIYLNKTCYNGLFRVNSRNQFNTPFGDNKRATVCDAAALRACSRLLQGASIEHASFEATLAKAAAGDFAYCDPPYVPAKPNAFDKYTASGFGPAEHTRLRDVALDARRRDVRMLISNSDTPLVRKLYEGPQFRIIPMHAPRSIAANPSRRGAVSELLIANY